MHSNRGALRKTILNSATVEVGVSSTAEAKTGTEQ